MSSLGLSSAIPQKEPLKNPVDPALKHIQPITPGTKEVSIGIFSRIGSLVKIIMAALGRFLSLGLYAPREGAFGEWWREFTSGKKEIKVFPVNPVTPPGPAVNPVVPPKPPVNPAVTVDPVNPSGKPNLEIPVIPVPVPGPDASATGSREVPDTDQGRALAQTAVVADNSFKKPRKVVTTVVVETEEELQERLALRDKKFDSIKTVILNKSVQEWMKLAKANWMLSETKLYKDLVVLSEAIAKQDKKAVVEDLAKKYADHESKIGEIVNAKNPELNKIIQQQIDEFVFSSLIYNQFGIFELIRNFTDEQGTFVHGKFQNNMCALLDLVQTVFGDPESAFADFQSKIDAKENAAAKNAFLAYKEILSPKNLNKRIAQYRVLEASVQKAIPGIAEQMHQIKLLGDVKAPLKDAQLLESLKKLNASFKSIRVPKEFTLYQSLRNELIQGLPPTTMPYILLKQKSERPCSNELRGELNAAIDHMKEYLGSSSKDKLGFVIGLGNQARKKPAKAFNKYLETENVIQFTETVSSLPNSSANVNSFLVKINESLNTKTYAADELLAVEAFVTLTLYTYITNPKNIIDGKFQEIITNLNKIKTTLDAKLNENSIREQVAALRKTDLNQKFYEFVKEKMEVTPDYPKNFWLDARSPEKMKIADNLLPKIGFKIASPAKILEEPAVLIHSGVGYEVYFYPAEGKTEKPKLLFFLTSPSSYSTMQAMNHQLGLFGDPTILASAEEILSNLTSTNVLEGYQNDLAEGNLEIIAAGFDNSGSAATIVANRMATLYPKTEVISIAAGSTTVVTTEDAHNMNQAKNFFPIRLQSAKDIWVARKQNCFGDFSNDIYNTFPLFVHYNHVLVDGSGHHKEEYGNIDHFVPAMVNPLTLRGLYDDVAGRITYSDPEVGKIEAGSDLHRSLLDSFFGSSREPEPLPEKPLNIAELDALIDLGKMMRSNIKGYDAAFLKLDKQKLSTASKAKQLQELEKEKAKALGLAQEALKKSTLGSTPAATGISLNPLTWFGASPAPAPTVQPVIQTHILTREEEENTILALQQALIYLRNPEVMHLVSAEKAFSLLIAADTLFLNYTKINMNIGKMPQLTGLINEMKDLAANRLAALHEAGNKVERKKIKNLYREKSNSVAGNLAYLAQRAQSHNPHYERLFGEKDVLGKIDFEDQFLEYIGFKTAVKDKEKIGSESYASKLHSEKDNYDISLFTPQDPTKKQRIVICCNGKDELGHHNTVEGDLGSGDVAILNRASALKTEISKQLAEQFKTHAFAAEDVEIVVTGFGAEGAVATALGYHLAREFQNPACQVRAIGFGAPRFTTEQSATKIENQPNYIPIRFLSPSDLIYEQKMRAGSYRVTNATYYTIPFQFRIVEALEFGGHSANLYGDVQGIKTSMKTAYQMRDIANERKALLRNIALRASMGGADSIVLPKRIIVDTRKVTLGILSGKSVSAMRQEQPGKLIQIMKYCVELSERNDLSDADAAVIKSFFKTFMEAIKNDDINETHSIENHFYKKMVTHGYKPSQLFAGKWKFQQIISEDLNKAMADVANAPSKLSQKEKAELILRRSYYRGILAGDLNGNRYKPAGGGVNGAVFFRHLESGIKIPANLLPDETSHIPFLGVFKPHPETVKAFKGWFDATQWGERLKAVDGLGGMDSRLNKSDPDKRVHNEIFAYELFHIFGFDPYIGFPTTLKVTNKNDAEGRPASFCAFMPGLDIVGMHVKSVKGAVTNKLDSAVNTYSEEERHIWEMSKIFDFLTGNMDGHEGNAFVKFEKGKLVKAVNFDYDKAFAIEKTPGITNQYKWAGLNISKGNFTPATRAALKEMLKDPKAEEMILAFLAIARKENSVNFAETQEKLLRERIEVLKLIAAGDGSITKLSHLKRFK